MNVQDFKPEDNEIAANTGWPQSGTPCRWFRPANLDKIERSSGLAGFGEYGVGQPHRWPK